MLWLLLVAVVAIVGSIIVYSFVSRSLRYQYAILPFHFIVISIIAPILLKHVIKQRHELMDKNPESKVLYACMLACVLFIIGAAIWVAANVVPIIRHKDEVFAILFIFFRASHVAVLGLVLNLFLIRSGKD